METWQAIDTIRVIREFDGKPLAEDELKRIVHAGRRAGSSKNLQRWAFVLVRDRSRLEKLGDSGPWAGHVKGAAAAIALVTPSPEEHPLSLMFDLGRAAQNMVLAAWDLGIGSAPATVYEHDLVRAVLSLPSDHHCEYILSFGYPADPSELSAPKRAGGRGSASEILHEETW